MTCAPTSPVMEYPSSRCRKSIISSPLGPSPKVSARNRSQRGVGIDRGAAVVEREWKSLVGSGVRISPVRRSTMPAGVHSAYGSASRRAAWSTMPGADLAWASIAFMPLVLSARRRCCCSAAGVNTPRGSVLARDSARSPAAHITVSSSSTCQRVLSQRNQPSPGTCR